MSDIQTIYNQLLALRNNLPEGKHVSKKYVDEFHTLLKKFEDLPSISLTDYYISPTSLEHTSGVFRPGIGFKGLGDPECERGFLLAKLDAVLLMFTSPEKPVMGFQMPEE